MKQIVGAFSILFILLLNTFLGIALLNVSSEAAAAKEYKAAVIAEIENSNFNNNIMRQCVSDANAKGYQLEIRNCLYDVYRNIQTAEVILHYQYRIPLFGITQVKTVKGIAR